MSRAPEQVVLFGGQGSGKGTQAERLAERLDAALIGAGDLLRKMAKEDTPVSRQIAPIVRAGELVPDEIPSEIIDAQLKDLPRDRGFVLEGYPRTVNQSEHLRATLARLRPASVTTFVSLDVPRDVLQRRLLGRRRHDDTAGVIERRLRIYEERTKPVLDAVADWATVVRVNGDQPVPGVTDAIIKEMEHAKAKA